MRKPLAIAVILVATLALAGPASAEEMKFEAQLSGAEENPPVATEGEGEAKFESDGTSVAFELKWQNLKASAFAAHIHCGVRGMNGPVGVTLFANPMGTEGEVRGTFTAPDPGNRCGWATLSDVLAAMTSGATYVNIHTPPHPGGEIRGQVTVA